MITGKALRFSDLLIFGSIRTVKKKFIAVKDDWVGDRLTREVSRSDKLGAAVCGVEARVTSLLQIRGSDGRPLPRPFQSSLPELPRVLVKGPFCPEKNLSKLSYILFFLKHLTVHRIYRHYKGSICEVNGL